MTKIDSSFGDPTKSEDQKYLETLMADMGLRDLNELSPSEREAFINASKPTYKMKRKSSLESLYKSAKKRKKKRDPKKGTGKKPKGSGRRLYTDENPKDTCSVSFTSASAIRKTFSTSCFKSKSHARQSQIINLVHQRVRAAYQNAKDPKVKKRLKKALEYAEKRKESSKKKTKRLRKKKSFNDLHNLYKVASKNMNIEDLINDPNVIMEVGDFTDLNDTNISPEEALQVGYMLGVDNPNDEGNLFSEDYKYILRIEGEYNNSENKRDIAEYKTPHEAVEAGLFYINEANELFGDIESDWMLLESNLKEGIFVAKRDMPGSKPCLYLRSIKKKKKYFNKLHKFYKITSKPVMSDDLVNHSKSYNKPKKGQKKRWSTKYKKSINCNKPKGFSQKQYCKRKKRGGNYKKTN